MDGLSPDIQAIGPEVDEWMLFLSRNGFKELEIDNSNMIPYTVPSCVFSCSLSDLKLRNCSLKPPVDFNGFNRLVNLELVKVSMSATLLRNTPLLKNILKVEELYLNGFSLRYLGTSDPHKHKGLIPSAITDIVIRGFRSDNINQISSVICLLKSCPGLMTLKLEIMELANYDAIEPDVEHFEQFNYMDVSLDHLQMVSIKFMKGIKHVCRR